MYNAQPEIDKDAQIKKLKLDFCCLRKKGSSSTMSIKLQNFNGNKDLAYPLGVFSVTGNYLGIATTETEYKTLWNADVDNQALGLILSGSGTTFTVVPVNINSVINLYGLEYWQVSSSSNNVILHLDSGDYVQYNSTFIDVGASGLLSASSGETQYNGGYHANQFIPDTFNFRKVTTTATAGTIINIFHSRAGKYCGHNALTPVTLITGVLPTALEVFYVRGTRTVNFNTFTNWSSLTNLKWFIVHNAGGSPFDVTTPSYVPQPSSSVLGIAIGDFGIINPGDFGWLTAANYPNLRQLYVLRNSTDLIHDSLTWLTTAPSFTESFFISQSNGASAADADAFINGLYSIVSGVTPIGLKKIRVKTSSARTAASDTAYNALISNGWTITLT